MESPSKPWHSRLAFVVLITTIQLPFALAQAPPDVPAISRADAVADLDALFAAIERIHPAPYVNRSRELVEEDRRQLTGSLPETLTPMQWWMRLAPIVASLGDGHTEAPPPPAFMEQWVAIYRDGNAQSNQREIFERIHLFPSGTVAVEEDRHLIVTATNLGNGIQRGDRVLSINGQDADRLLSEWIRETSGDSEANRAASTILRLSDLLAAHSIVSPYRLTVAGQDGVERTASIQGSSMQSAVDARRAASPNFAYRVLQPGVGYMDFYSMDGDYGRFKEALAAMFQRVAADGIRILIVDVRNNIGGYVQFGEELLRYVARTPYRSWSRQEVKRSAEMRAEGFVRPPFRWAPLKYLIPDARRLYAGPEGTLAVWTQPSLKTPRPVEPFFSGPVCVLTGPRTFSSAVVLADAVKTYRLGTIVGEETGGRANMTMQPVAYVLPHSKFPVAIAVGRSFRANGDPDDRNGVIPDIVVNTTAADIRDGRDAALDRARECPRLQ